MGERNFYFYFKESMDYLGLPAPESLYADLTVALATTKAFYEVVKIGGLGGRTMGQLMQLVAGGGAAGAAVGGAGAAELVAAAGGLLASFYVGAVIGALIYATARTAPSKLGEIRNALGASIYDLLNYSRRQSYQR